MPLSLITYFKIQIIEDLKGTVLHFHFLHLSLFPEFGWVTKCYRRLEPYWNQL